MATLLTASTYGGIKNKAPWRSLFSERQGAFVM